MKERAIQEGVAFENKVKELINSTSLRHYTFHQLQISTGISYIIPDHIIFLPHKVIVIEDKLKNAEDIKIFNKFDAVKVKGYDSNKVYDSLVNQVTIHKQVLKDILNKADKDFIIPLDLPFSIFQGGKGVTTVSEMVLQDITFKVEGVCCIKAEGATITSFQTKVPLLTLEALEKYLSILETEISFFDKKLIDWTFENRIKLLLNYVEKKKGSPLEADSIFNY